MDLREKLKSAFKIQNNCMYEETKKLLIKDLNEGLLDFDKFQSHEQFKEILKNYPKDYATLEEMLGYIKYHKNRGREIIAQLIKEKIILTEELHYQKSRALAYEAGRKIELHEILKRGEKIDKECKRIERRRNFINKLKSFLPK